MAGEDDNGDEENVFESLLSFGFARTCWVRICRDMTSTYFEFKL